MALKIIQEGDAVLRRKAEPVTDPKSPEISKLVKEMLKTMKQAGGVGLAAPQIGRSLTVFTVQIEKEIYVFINPEIKDLSDEKVSFEEGCLSVQNVWGPVVRPKKLTVKAVDENGRPFKMRVRGFLARVIQHEMDHLNGILFIDKAEKLYKVREEK